MQFEEYIIQDIKLEAKDTYILTLKNISNKPFLFKPGQFCHVKNPSWQKNESRPLSMTSLPREKTIEFCFKIFGKWTRALSQKKRGDSLFLFGPLGAFTWTTPSHAVFLVGGVGIAPVMSMIRKLQKENDVTPVTLIYGNRTIDSIPYKKELDAFFKNRLNSKLIHTLSELKGTDQWDGARGYITQEIIKNSVNLNADNTYFVCGTGAFVDAMKEILLSLHIDQTKIKQELYSPHGKS